MTALREPRGAARPGSARRCPGADRRRVRATASSSPITAAAGASARGSSPILACVSDAASAEDARLAEERGRPFRNAAASIARPPSGRTRTSRRRPCRGRHRERRGHRRGTLPGSPPESTAPPPRPRARRACRRSSPATSRAMAGRRGPAAPARPRAASTSRRPSSRRERPGQRRALVRLGLAAARAPARYGSSHVTRRSAARSARSASSSGAVSVPGSGTTRWPPRSDPCRGPRPCASASRRCRCRPRGSSPGSASRRGAAGSSDGWRLSAPWREVEERRRHELPVVGEDREARLEREDLGDRLGRPEARRDEDRDRRGRRPRATRRRREAPGDGPRGRAGAVTTPTSSTRRVRRERAQARDGERAAAQEDRPDAPDARRPLGHASALVALRISASSSSSSPWPTGISSSIESR